MLNYIARVELRGQPSSKDYDNLHEAMRKKGFLRTVADSKTTFHLPTGEYVWATTVDVATSALRAELKTIISAVHNDFLLIVAKAQYSDVSWWLSPV